MSVSRAYGVITRPLPPQHERDELWHVLAEQVRRLGEADIFIRYHPIDQDRPENGSNPRTALVHPTDVP